jgi:hypothetical protein
MLSSFATLLLSGSLAGAIVFKVPAVDIGAIVVLLLACSQGSKSRQTIRWLKIFMVVYVIGSAAIFVAAAIKAPGLKVADGPVTQQAMQWAMACAGTVSVWAAINLILLLKIKAEPQPSE